MTSRHEKYTDKTKMRQTATQDTTAALEAGHITIQKSSCDLDPDLKNFPKLPIEGFFRQTLAPSWSEEVAIY